MPNGKHGPQLPHPGRRGRRLKTLLGACLALAVASACGSGAQEEKAAGEKPKPVLRFGVPVPLNDWETIDRGNSTYTSLVYEGLVGLASNGVTIIPGLAKEWKVSDSEITFTLEENVVFHDGTPFDAAAAVKNLERMRSTSARWKGTMGTVTAFEAVDAKTLRIKLKGAAPALLPNLARSQGYIISPAAIEAGTWAKTPAGTGPYAYDPSRSVAGSKVMAKVFDRYRHPEKIGTGGIEVHFINDPDSLLNALTVGQLDIAYTVASYDKRVEQSGLGLATYPSSLFHLQMYDTKGVFGDKKVRQAICLAMNPQEYADTQYRGYSKVHLQRMKEGQQGYNPQVAGYPHDLAKAKQLMAEAGNPKVSFVLPSYDIQRSIAELFRAQMGEIGVDVKLDMMTWGQFYSVYNNGKYPAAILSDFGDASAYDYYLYKFFPGGAGNPKKVAYPELDKVVEKALAAPDEKAAAADWAEMTKIVNDEALDCGYFEQPYFWAFNKKKVDKVDSTATVPAAIRYAELVAKG
ncbi:peptide/nickel transport system substrate-binding protein [Sinosporangium album]|uniref:Peptide/nickel transport system substrate-binding protein n=1 Tax=Sinosporangium album TaxID=504805 RepID=A0A1G8IHY5_9ACTN|nr:ABC transporter substrate-binding protein [Sinosporangium album]SDI18515.1 peptide/nickel transport system substrate-binding protein [Sinosporangium album]